MAQRFKVGDRVRSKAYPYSHGRIVTVRRTLYEVESLGEPHERIWYSADEIQHVGEEGKHAKG